MTGCCAAGLPIEGFRMRSASFAARCAVLIGLGAVVATTGPARAQMESREGIALQNQILELRHELEQIENNGGGGGAPVAPPIGNQSAAPGTVDGGGLAPQLLDRVQTLEQQVRDMRGELDQLANQVQQQNATLSKQISDMSFALQQGHGGVPSSGSNGGAPAASAPVAAPAAPPPAPVRHTPETSLAAGNAALARHDYAAAQGAAQEVLSGPRSPRQIDAQFLLGQSLAGQRQFQQAAVAYYDAYNRAPRSGRAPDALLGVSASMIALGDKPSACQALAKLHAEFPSPLPRVRSASAALRSRAGCR
jgi:TolA-binding protein